MRQYRSPQPRDFYPAILLSARKEYVDQLDEMMWKDRIRTRSQLATIALSEYAERHGHPALPRRLEGRGKKSELRLSQ